MQTSVEIMGATTTIALLLSTLCILCALAYGMPDDLAKQESRRYMQHYRPSSSHSQSQDRGYGNQAMTHETKEPAYVSPQHQDYNHNGRVEPGYEDSSEEYGSSSEEYGESSEEYGDSSEEYDDSSEEAGYGSNGGYGKPTVRNRGYGKYMRPLRSSGHNSHMIENTRGYDNPAPSYESSNRYEKPMKSYATSSGKDENNNEHGIAISRYDSSYKKQTSQHESNNGYGKPMMSYQSNTNHGNPQRKPEITRSSYGNPKTEYGRRGGYEITMNRGYEKKVESHTNRGGYIKPTTTYGSGQSYEKPMRRYEDRSSYGTPMRQHESSNGYGKQMRRHGSISRYGKSY